MTPVEAREKALEAEFAGVSDGEIVALYNGPALGYAEDRTKNRDAGDEAMRRMGRRSVVWEWSTEAALGDGAITVASRERRAAVAALAARAAAPA